MKEIQLTQGTMAIVDDEDFEAMNVFKWYALRHCHTFYAVRGAPKPGGGQTHESMHRVILARKLGRVLLKKEEVDHKHGDGLDNRREKLRLATSAQNKRNCRRRNANPSSRYLGVSWFKDRKKWHAQICVNYKSIHLGDHATELAAAQAREVYIEAHPELMARSNLTEMETDDHV